MSLRTALLAPLLLVGLGLAAWVQLTPNGGQAQQATCGKVHRDVLDALSSETEVEVIVSLQPPSGPLQEVSIDEMRLNTQQNQASVLAELSSSDFALTYQYSVAPALTGRITVAAADVLDCHPAVTGVHLDRDLSVALTESVPLIHADDVHTEGLDGTGVDVAVLDTGIDTDHPDLLDSIIGEECFRQCDNGTDRQSGPGAAEDDHGHGTHVSGIITSNGATPGIPVGVAPNADIFAYKVCGLVDSRPSCPMSTVFAAWDHILANHAGEFEFINMSLQLDNGLPQQDCERMFGTGPVDTMTLLRAGGTLSIASSGNNVRKSSIAYPACIGVVVSVGGTYDGDLGFTEWRTPSGTLLCSETTAADKAICFSDSADWLDVLAPGAEILSTWPFVYGVALRSGTSMASPHAVGVAALLLDAEPGLTPDEIVARLKLGPFVTDYFDPNNIRTTPRVDARIALLSTHGEEDFDLDGCSNQEELGPDETLGGLRNPLNRWDFYDVDGDKYVDLTTDILPVAFRYHLRGDYETEVTTQANAGQTQIDVTISASHELQEGDTITIGSGDSAETKEIASVDFSNYPTVTLTLTAPLANKHPVGDTVFRGQDEDYDEIYDRGPSVGPNVWNLTGPDGYIDLIPDISGVSNQYHHDCRPAP